MNIDAYCCFLGTAGYNYHSRNFFTTLNRHANVGVFNWSHDPNPYYLTSEQRLMMANRFAKPDVTILLHETNHEDWYKRVYGSPKIAYNVWESTRQPDKFFDKLLEFDEIWVPTEWQRQCTIAQGADSGKVFVIPEGIDFERFRPNKPLVDSNYKPMISSKGKFTFTVVGRWEYRKATSEIITSFARVFEGYNDVELLLLVDNPFDRSATTEDKLKSLNIDCNNIRIINGPISEGMYDILIKETDCYISCSRAEGWNLPLLEFMACGIPSICSAHGAQLEFAHDVACVIDHTKMIPAGRFPGEYIEPNWTMLQEQMYVIYNEYDQFYIRAQEGLPQIRAFSWENAAQKAMARLEQVVSEPINKSKEGDLIGPGFDAMMDALTAKEKVLTEMLDIKDEPTKDVTAIREVVVMDCYPDSDMKVDMLEKLRLQVMEANPTVDVALVTHYPVSDEVYRGTFDYFIYDNHNDLPNYSLPASYSFKTARINGKLDRPYHALPIVKSLQNVCRMFEGEYDIIHFLEYDINADLRKHFSLVKEAYQHGKKFYGYNYEGTGVYTNIMSFTPTFMKEVVTGVSNWDAYKSRVLPMDEKYIFENWMLSNIEKKSEDLAIGIIDNISYSADSVKQLPQYNFMCAETIEGDTVVFFTFGTYPADGVSVIIGNSETKLIKADGFYYGVVEPTVDELEIVVKTPYMRNRYTDILNRRKECEFVFYGDLGESIRCVTTNSLKDSVSHNISIKNYYVDGPFVEITGPDKHEYAVYFTDRLTGHVAHVGHIKSGMWTKANRKYYTAWNTKIVCLSDDQIIYDRNMDLKGRRVFVVLTSKSIGDTLAWMPYVEVFQKKHDAVVLCSTFHNKMFKDCYPSITFIEPGTMVPDIYAQYNVGCYDNDLKYNKFNWRITSLQKVASDILGLKYEEIKPRLVVQQHPRPTDARYVAISEHSTFQCKYWMYPDGWQTIVDWLRDMGYAVVVVSKEETKLKNIINKTNRPWEESVSTINQAEMFLGVSSGPTWLAWALGIPTVLISGYSTAWAEMKDSVQHARVINEEVCHGCFNDPSLALDRGNWNWCPRSRDFECTRSITPEMVMDRIKNIISDKFYILGEDPRFDNSSPGEV